MNTNTRKSTGHIAFFLPKYSDQWQEIYKYTLGDGSICVAPVSNAMDTDGFRHGRWESYADREAMCKQNLKTHSTDWIEA